MTLQIIRSISEIRACSRAAKRIGKTVALVPTMGGLHEGHLSLVRRAQTIADEVIVSIFVNPKQFNNPQDLETYPSVEADDIAALTEIGADFAFMPAVDEIYPPDFASTVSVEGARKILCDAHRPGHFTGVTTVVAKLFNQVEPDFACFGEKDFQQLFIVTKMVRDLDMAVEIIPCKTIRESDGLALSSRNARLSPQARKIAPQLKQAMQLAADDINKDTSPDAACRTATGNLEKSGHFEVEYLEYRSGRTLDLARHHTADGRIFAAAWLDGVRLIDNQAVTNDPE